MKYVKTNDNNIAAFVNGKSYYITPENANYDELYNALCDGDAEAFATYLVDEENLNKYCEGYVSFSNGMPTWDGVPMPDLFSDRILELVSGGQPFEPMINFTANLAENPSDHSIMELIDFLGNKNLPITKDGCFLAYKAVKNDYMDIYSGTIDNSVGQSPQVERSEVDSNRNRHCSNGLHVGAIDYVVDYGSVDIDNYNPDEPDEYNSVGNRIVVVKVNPKDVVTVPPDCSFMKLRCCKYTVLADFTGVLEDAVYEDAMFLPKEKVEEDAPLEVASDQPQSLLQTKPEGWKEILKNKFARILNLMSNKNA